MNQEMFRVYKKYQYSLRQQKLQLGETFCDYEPASRLLSSDKIKQICNDSKAQDWFQYHHREDKKQNEKIRVVYLVKNIEVLLPIYLN